MVALSTATYRPMVVMIFLPVPSSQLCDSGRPRAGLWGNGGCVVWIQVPALPFTSHVLWASDLTLLCLCFLICRMGEIPVSFNPPSQGRSEDSVRCYIKPGRMPGTEQASLCVWASSLGTPASPAPIPRLTPLSQLLRAVGVV